MMGRWLLRALTACTGAVAGDGRRLLCLEMLSRKSACFFCHPLCITHRAAIALVYKDDIAVQRQQQASINSQSARRPSSVTRPHRLLRVQGWVRDWDALPRPLLPAQGSRSDPRAFVSPLLVLRVMAIPSTVTLSNLRVTKTNSATTTRGYHRSSSAPPSRLKHPASPPAQLLPPHQIETKNQR